VPAKPTRAEVGRAPAPSSVDGRAGRDVAGHGGPRSGSEAATSLFDGFERALGSGTGALAAGIDGLIGPRATSIGAGPGGRGRGLGGGGDADGLDGFPGGRHRGGPGPGRGDDAGRPCCRPPLPTGDDALVLGEMPRSQIDEVIRRHLPQIRYCYQRRLQVAPELSGKLVVRFAIARDGSVASAARKGGSLEDADVDACVIGWFRKMSFPEPPGGGVVIVTYPFTFAPA
jgi:hypothetical protein